MAKKKRTRNSGEVRIGYPTTDEHGEPCVAFYPDTFSDVAEAEKFLQSDIIPQDAEEMVAFKNSGPRTYVIARLYKTITVAAKIEYTLNTDSSFDFLGSDEEDEEDEENEGGDGQSEATVTAPEVAKKAPKSSGASVTTSETQTVESSEEAIPALVLPEQQSTSKATLATQEEWHGFPSADTEPKAASSSIETNPLAPTAPPSGKTSKDTASTPEQTSLSLEDIE